MLTHAQLSKQAARDYYTRAVKLKLEGCMCSKNEVAALYELGQAHRKKKQKNKKSTALKATKHKLETVNALGFALTIVVNGFIRILREHCLNVSLDLREVPANTPLTKPPRKFGLDAWTLLFLHEKAHANFAGPLFLSTYTAISERAKSQCLRKALQMLKAVDNSKQERAYQQAHGVRKAACPVLRSDASIPIDKKFVKFSLECKGEVRMKSFDVAMHLSIIGGKQGKKRMVIPLKSTKVLSKWLSYPGADILEGCELTKNAVIVYVRIPVQPLLPSASKGSPFSVVSIASQRQTACAGSFPVMGTPIPSGADRLRGTAAQFKSYRHRLLSLIEGSTVAPPGAATPIASHQVFSLDLGIKKLMVLTNLTAVSPQGAHGDNPMKLVNVSHMAEVPPQGEFSAFFGEVWQNVLLDKRLRKKWGSRAFKRAAEEHRQLIEYELNRLPFERMKILVIENLTNIKKHKTNKKVLLWLVAFLVKRITEKCEEHRVLMDFVHPAYTSQTCPLCRISKASNRVAESYKCRCPCFPVKPLDADFVGAFNVRRRFLESVKEYGGIKTPKLKPPQQQTSVKTTHISRKGVAP